MNALKVAAIGAEIAVVSTLAVSSYHVAFSGSNPDWLAGAPILTVVALESMRLPLAFRLPKMRFMGLAAGLAMLAGLSVITGEAASLAFENLIFQRTRPVAEAERDLARVQIGRDALNAATDRRAEEVSRLTADVDSARKHRTEIDKPLALQTPPASKACAGRRGSTWNCSAVVQGSVAAANAAAMKAHAAELTAASEAVRAAEGRLAATEPAPDMRASDAAAAEARREVSDARAVNPMLRVAAAWQRTPVEDLTLEQFEAVKHYAVIALAIATALTTALAAVISSLPERDSRPGKLARAVRAMLAARRKRIRRLEATTVTQIRERVVYRYVPCDPESGKAIG